MTNLNNLWVSNELKQFKQKLSWLCTFSNGNFDIYYENKKNNQMDKALTYKMAGLFSTLKALDIGIYIAKKEEKENLIPLMSSLKEYIEVSIGFDGFEKDIIISNIRELIETVLISLCEIKEEKDLESIFAWGKDMNIINREQTHEIIEKTSIPQKDSIKGLNKQPSQQQPLMPQMQPSNTTAQIHSVSQTPPQYLPTQEIEYDNMPRVQNNYLNARFAQADKEEGAPIQIPPPNNVRQK